MLQKLAPRERQIMECLYAKGDSSVPEILAGLEKPPSESAVRAMLSRLEAKGFVTRTRVEKAYVYAPAVPEEKALKSALSQLVGTFFRGRFAPAATALLGMSEDLELEELEELERVIAQARKERLK
jgi:predicted transcriptional regulator